MSDKRLKKLNRHQALGVLGAAGASLVASNGSTPTSPTAITTTTTTTTTTPTTTSATACAVTPPETAGPFPSITLPILSDVRGDRTGSDGFTSVLATLLGNTARGYNATLQVGITT